MYNFVYFKNNGLNKDVNNYILNNYNLSGVDIDSSDVDNPNDLKMLLDKKCVVNKYEFPRMLESGIFADNENVDISIECIKMINQKGVKVSKKIVLNSLTVIKYLFDNDIVAEIGHNYYDYDSIILNTNDLDKIKYLGTKITYGSDILSRGGCVLNFDVLEYLHDTEVCTVNQMFINVDGLDTFIKLYNKYWSSFTYQQCDYIICDYLRNNYKGHNYIDVLNFLYDNAYDTLSEIVKDNYEQNKRKKLYSDEVREWIKAKFFAKKASTKVKKIREMFEYVFKNI